MNRLDTERREGEKTRNVYERKVCLVLYHQPWIQSVRARSIYSTHTAKSMM
jgi:hypothetical protein